MPNLIRSTALGMLVISLLALACAAGCDKKKGVTPSPGQTSQAPSSPATSQVSASGRASDTNGSLSTSHLSIPQVGVPFVTRDQYKPVPGKPGGRLVNETLGEPKSFNPITAGETSTTNFTMHMFEGLTDTDPFTGDTRPSLAKKWEVSGDGLTWTFHLRHDVVFNDGSPMSAKDVAFTWNELVYDSSRPVGKEPRWPCSMRDITTFDGKPLKVEAVDDYTVRFITPVKVAIMEDLAGEGILSRAKYGAAVKDGSFGGAMGSDSQSQDIVGTGPFMLGQYVRGEKVTLKRNPNYWRRDSAGGKMPYLDEIVYLVVRDLNVSLVNFQQGITDAFSLRSGKDVGVLRPKQKEGNFTLYQLGPDYGTSFVAFNMNSDAAARGKIPEYKAKWFRDQRFRQAVAYAIDRGALVRNVLRNLGYPQAAPFTLAPGPFHQEGFVPYPHDPAKARALLAEMGLKDRDGSGILSDEQGHKVSFTINTNAGNDVREATADFVREDLKAVGMDVNTLFLEFNLLVDKMDTRYDWECIVMGLTGGLEPLAGGNVWKSFGRLHMWWPNQKTPGFPCEGRIDQIFNDGMSVIDKAERKKMFREWVQIAYDQEPFVFLAVGERVAALRNRFGNVFPSPAPSSPVLHNLEEIYVLDGK